MLVVVVVVVVVLVLVLVLVLVVATTANHRPPVPHMMWCAIIWRCCTREGIDCSVTWTEHEGVGSSSSSNSSSSSSSTSLKWAAFRRSCALLRTCWTPLAGRCLQHMTLQHAHIRDRQLSLAQVTLKQLVRP
jgi:hypothetical protein